MWLGLDDTDSPRGGCTTWALTELVRVARAHRLDLLGEPRLVRLNPNVPWKTRGNAALAMRLGRGRGRGQSVGEIDGSPVLAYAAGRPARVAESRDVLQQAWDRLAELAPRDRGTDPALVAVDRRLPASLYWNAVRELVRLDAVEPVLARCGAAVHVRGGRRGVIGASAAIAWPARRATWELIAYRAPELVGLPRRVDPDSVREAQVSHPQLFLCHDDRTRRTLIAPHTDCPILFGLRGLDPDAPRAARTSIVSEGADRWMLFRTNQASGDHLVVRRASELRAYRSATVEGTVAGPPLRLPGGHVRFRLRDREGDAVTCLAFEPTKTLPAAARDLVPGDRLRVWGAYGGRRTIRLEGLEVVRLAPMGRVVPPPCPGCGRVSRSLGTGRGWRCPACHRRSPPEAARWQVTVRSLRPGTVHPTPSARRHLAPLP